MVIQFAEFGLLMPFVRIPKDCLDMVAFRKVNRTILFSLLFYILLVTGTIFSFVLTYYRQINADGSISVRFFSTDQVIVAFIFFGVFSITWFIFTLVVYCSILLLVVHLLMWNVFKRPLYAMTRYKLFGQHKTLGILGLFFIGLGIPHLWHFETIRTLI